MVQVSEDRLKEAIALLDGLLGVDVRKPGTAARLPAVIRVVESLEPAGGMEFPVFPASYAGDGQNAPPVYDLNGVEYGPEVEVIHGKDRDRHRREPVRARQCTMDSPQSQANRTEIAFLEDEELQSLVPQASVTIPRAEGKRESESVLSLPHRVADFRVRLSDKQGEVEAAINAFADGDSLKLLRLMPTSVVFGFWDSRGKGTQPKHARILMSRIDAFDVVPCKKHALYSGPYSKDEFERVVLTGNELSATVQEETDSDAEEAKSVAARRKKMAQLGYTAAPSEGLGGVLVQGTIERLSLISVTDIARLRCLDGDAGAQKALTNAARRYVLTLALLAEGHPRATGSHRLRSGCELLAKQSGLKVELRGGDGSYSDAARLLAFLVDREDLLAVAAQAKGVLGIPKLDSFTVTAASLKADFEGAGSDQPAQTSAGVGKKKGGGQKAQK
ncbi:MAG TPA: type I-U CRISPR-associated RAMP protein Csb1/Cas7u [Bryobacteraceae bacterium]|nr:type I-U CRISPR-associated RAMP protein Csb1/Cas7u [Bryobacteraceae bacterium]